MSLNTQQLEEIINELQPLVGGRIQRLDLVADQEIVLEVRCPGQTVRVLVSAGANVGRAHVVEKRPPKLIPGGTLQKRLRERLVDRFLVGLSAGPKKSVLIDVPDARLVVRIDGGKSAFTFEPGQGLCKTDCGAIPERWPSSEKVAEAFKTRVLEESERSHRQRLLSALRKKIKKQKRLVARMIADRERLLKMKEGELLGELIKPLLGQSGGARGQTIVQAMDWTKGGSVDIPLDAERTLKENMERYFTRAKKAKRGLPIVEARRSKMEDRLAQLEAEREQIEHADLETLADLCRESTVGSDRVTKKEAQKKRQPVDGWAWRFISQDGREIRVGKGAKENDRLTLRFSRGDDIWLHARGTTGAHVVLRNQKGQVPSPEALLDAAHLAVHYSSAKRESKVEVIWTEARYVKKNKGDPPGLVSVARSKTMLVVVDEARLDRLLDRG